MIITYKYRVKDCSAKRVLRQHAYAVNQVWNYCVAVQRDVEARHRAGAARRKWPTHFDLTAVTSGTSKELGIHSHTVTAVCGQFATNRDRAKGALRFRSSGGPKRALGWVPFTRNARQVTGDAVTYLGKRYRFFGAKRRPLPATARGGAFVEDARGRWYACFHVEVADASPTGTNEVGIDLGLKTLATCSDGEIIPALQHFRRYEARLALAQRASNKRRVRAIHAKIANTRRDQLHKATAKIARENQLIVVGNVSSRKLVKTRMAKSVLDASWAMLKHQLAYKASRHGAVFLEVSERWTSQTCSCCGTIPASSPKGKGALGIRRWECSECGAVHDRDVNAAINILTAGRSVPPHADESRRAA